MSGTCKIWPRKVCLIEEQTYRNVDKATAATRHFKSTIHILYIMYRITRYTGYITRYTWYTGNPQVEQVTKIKYLSCLHYPPAPVVQNSAWWSCHWQLPLWYTKSVHKEGTSKHRTLRAMQWSQCRNIIHAFRRSIIPKTI